MEDWGQFSPGSEDMELMQAEEQNRLILNDTIRREDESDEEVEEGGYPQSRFVNPEQFESTESSHMSRFLCAVCNDVMREPTRLPCGHLFCLCCIESWLKQHRRGGTCPVDREPAKISDLSPDSFVMGVIGDLQIFCKKKAKGCEWIGELRNAKAHEETDCQFVRVGCSNDECKVMGKLDEHRAQCPCRLVECPHCEQPFPHHAIPDHINASCPAVMIECTDKCGTSVRRDRLEEHSKVCVNGIISCPFVGIGCGEARISRAELPSHMNTGMSTHVEYLLREVMRLGDENAQLKETMRRMTDKPGWPAEVTKNVQLQDTRRGEGSGRLIPTTGRGGRSFRERVRERKRESRAMEHAYQQTPRLSAAEMVGRRVIRGDHWKVCMCFSDTDVSQWGNQDGGAGNVGDVVTDEGNGWLLVRWQGQSTANGYRWGLMKNGMEYFDLKLVESLSLE